MASSGSNTKSTYTFELNDEASASAKQIADALGQLKATIASDTAALGAMQKALKQLQSASTPNVDAITRLKGAIAAKSEAVANAQAKFVSLGGDFAKTQTKSRGLEARFAALTKQAQAMPGPLGVIVNRFNALKAIVGSGALAAGIIAVVAALGALVVVSAASVVALGKYAIAQADARRSELLRLEGLTKLRFWYGAAAGSATQIQGAIDRVAASSAISRDKVAQYATQLYKLGARGPQLERALEGVAIKASVQGEEAASAFAAAAAGAAITGRSVDAMVQRVKDRLGGIAQRQMYSLDVQAVKLREDMSALFADLGIDSFLKALANVRALLSQSTESGRSLKLILETLFQPMANAFETFGPLARRFFQGMIISALQFGIVVLQVALWFKRSFGSETKSKIDLTTAALNLGRVAFIGFASALAVSGLLMIGLFGVLLIKVYGLIGGLTVLQGMSLRGTASAMANLGRATLAAGKSFALMTFEVLKSVRAILVSKAGMMTYVNSALASLRAGLLAAWRGFLVMTQAAWSGVRALAAMAVQGALAAGRALAGMAVAAWRTVPALARVALQVIIATWPFLLLIATILLTINAVRLLVNLWKEIDFKLLASYMKDGLVDGIKSATSAVTEAMSGLATAAWESFKNTLKIGSPSKVFEQLGVAIPEGVVEGVESGTPGVQQSIASMTPAIPVSDVAGATGGAAGGGAAGRAPSSVSISIGELHISASGDKPKDFALDFKRELERVLEGVALQLGAPVAP